MTVAAPTAVSTRPGRAFLIGCPRSGTTLLQSLLFSHPDVISFPETFFFVHACNPTGTLHDLGLGSVGARRGLDSLAALDLLDPVGPVRWPVLR